MGVFYLLFNWHSAIPSHLLTETPFLFHLMKFHLCHTFKYTDICIYIPTLLIIFLISVLKHYNGDLISVVYIIV